MSDKKPIRYFLLTCCRLIKTFTFEDFSHDGNMTLVCHRHSEPIVRHINWRSGLMEEDYDKIMKEYKKNKAEAKKNLPPVA